MKTERVVRWLQGNGFSLMAILILANEVVNLILAEGGRTDQDLPVKRAILCLALVSGVYASEVKRAYRSGAIALAALSFLLEMLPEQPGASAAEAGLQAPLLLLVVYTLAVSFVHVMRTERVDLDKLAGSLCVYYLLAVFFALVYYVIHGLLEGGGFVNLVEPPLMEEAYDELFYFSWVTLTTVGYGDVVPEAPLARIFANLEAFIGQFYIAVVVARMVAIQVTTSLQGRRNP